MMMCRSRIWAGDVVVEGEGVIGGIGGVRDRRLDRRQRRLRMRRRGRRMRGSRGRIIGVGGGGGIGGGFILMPEVEILRLVGGLFVAVQHQESDTSFGDHLLLKDNLLPGCNEARYCDRRFRSEDN